MAISTSTKMFLTVMGDKVVGCYKLEGDGAETDWTAPVGTIDAAWFQRYDDTETSELLSWSGATVTFGAAPANGKLILLFFVGSA
jgi:hypothetical protein